LQVRAARDDGDRQAHRPREPHRFRDSVQVNKGTLESSASPSCEREAHRRGISDLRDDPIARASHRHRLKPLRVPEIVLNQL